MITPHLEKLIWEGKAFFKTFVAGGQKCTLNIGQDRFIIITDITYMPFQDRFFNLDQFNTQVSIYGEKGFNHYIFRNTNISQTPISVGGAASYELNYETMQPICINTYLLHTSQVGFSFICNGAYGLPTTGVASVDNPGYLPPLDYGKNGDPGAINVITDMPTLAGAMLNQFTNRQGSVLPVGTVTTQQLQFEANNFSLPPISNNYVYPTLNVNYVEILGEPTNIGF